MAVSLTALVQKYRLVHNKRLIPLSKIPDINNANSSTIQYYSNKVVGRIRHRLCDCGGASTVHLKDSPRLRNYSTVIQTISAYKNEKRAIQHGIFVGHHKGSRLFSLVAPSNKHFHTSSNHTSTRLTPIEATNILRKHEYTTDDNWLGPGDGHSPVKSFDMNSIRSNNPTEDAHSEAIIRVGTTAPNGMLFGIFDGHGGAACGQVSCC